MTFKISSFLIFFLTFTMTVSAQDEPNLLSGPDEWTSERLHFPLSFAPSLELVGFEDLRFAPHWKDKNNDQFWTYTFVWYLKKDIHLSTESLSRMLNDYYNGLMRIDPKNSDPKLGPLPTQSEFFKVEENYQGSIHTYDNFFTKMPITLHAQIVQKKCPETGEQYILFQLSPKDFIEDVWDEFKVIHLDANCQ